MFLKCFSGKEPIEEGPYKFSQGEMRDLFSDSLTIDSIKKTVYQGTLNPLSKARGQSCHDINGDIHSNGRATGDIYR